MHFNSILLFLAAAVSASARPGSHRSAQAAGANSATGPKSAIFACAHADKIANREMQEMARLKAENISIPGYLAGYYTGVNSERREIGCPGSKLDSKRNFTPLKAPCDVLNEQHERMMELINAFAADDIPIAPFISGFFTAAVDQNKGIGCLPFTGPATEAGAARIAAASNSTDQN